MGAHKLLPETRKKKGKRPTRRKHPSDTLNICHHNIHGLENREEMVKEFINQEKIHVEGLVETHAHGSDFTDVRLQWDPGPEQLPVNNRPPTKGIGFLYQRNTQLGTTFIGTYSQWVRLQLKHHEKPIYICESYFPHSRKIEEHKIAWAEIMSLVSKYSLEGHIILMGDFNAHTGANGDPTPVDGAGRLLLRNVNLMQLCLLNTHPICKGKYTRSVHHQTDLSSHDTTIDYMAISESLRPYVSDFRIHSNSLGSDHFPLILNLKGLKSLRLDRSGTHETWNLDNIPKCPAIEYAEPFHQAFIPWIEQHKTLISEYEESNKDMQELADIFEHNFQQRLEEIAMVKIGKKRIRSRAAPKMSSTIRFLEKTRQRIAEETRLILHNHRSPPELRKRAIEANQKAKRDLRQAHNKFRKAKEMERFLKITNSQTCSKSFWALIKRSRTTFKNTKSPPPMIDRDDGSIATDLMEILKIWKKYTQDQDRETAHDTHSFDNKFYKDMGTKLQLLQRTRHRQGQLDDSITKQEVWKAIRHLKMGKAAGVDGMVSDIIRAATGAIWNTELTPSNHTVEAITLLFNFVYDKEVWPSRWSQGIIVPLHKQDSPTNPANYRPITLLPIMQKLFGYVLNQRLLEWTEERDTLNDAQGGFRWNRSTVDQILLKREILRIRKEQGLTTFSTYIDIRKAYDKVWRGANFVRMYELGIQGKAWRQLQKMSNSLRCKIRLPNGETDWIQFQAGVAQGAVESPWVFNCFINGVAEELSKHGFGVLINGSRIALLMYADDIVLFANSITELQTMNRIVSQYAYKYRFKFNGTKSAVMVFNAKPHTRAKVTKTVWSLFGERVQVKSQYKYLGVIIDSRNPWNWKPHFKAVFKKANYTNRQLLYICKYDNGMAPRPARTFWMARVRPLLEYAAEIWYGEISQEIIKQAESIQTDFARGILGLHHADGISNTAILAELGMEPLEARWTKLRAGYWRRIFTYKNTRALKRLIDTRHAQTLANPHTQGWCTTTKQILEIHDLHSAWHHPRRCANLEKETWKEQVNKKVDVHYNNIRAQKMENQPSTMNYRGTKSWGQTPRHRCFSMNEQGKFGMRRVEPYLDDQAEPIGRKLKTLARLNALPLMDKIAKQEQWHPNRGKNRYLCPLCGEKVENIQHYLLECESLEFYRRKLMAKVVYSLMNAQTQHSHQMVKPSNNWWAPPERWSCPPEDPETEQPLTQYEFHRLPPNGKIQVLLGKQIGCPTAEKHIDTHVKRFLRKTWKLRRPHVEATNKKYNRNDYIVNY